MMRNRRDRGRELGWIDGLRDVRLESWQARACGQAGRNLTQAEWQQYFGGDPYRKTCEQWPEGE